MSEEEKMLLFEKIRREFEKCLPSILWRFITSEGKIVLSLFVSNASLLPIDIIILTGLRSGVVCYHLRKLSQEGIIIEKRLGLVGKYKTKIYTLNPKVAAELSQALGTLKSNKPV
jgi:DNA-binding transcriptional ArsR family regulator